MDNGGNEDVHAIAPIPRNDDDNAVIEEPATMASLDMQEDVQREDDK